MQFPDLFSELSDFILLWGLGEVLAVPGGGEVLVASEDVKGHVKEHVHEVLQVDLLALASAHVFRGSSTFSFDEGKHLLEVIQTDVLETGLFLPDYVVEVVNLDAGGVDLAVFDGALEVNAALYDGLKDVLGWSLRRSRLSVDDEGVGDLLRGWSVMLKVIVYHS